MYIGANTVTSGSVLFLDNVFTSTYTNYRIVLSGVTTVAAFGLQMQLRAGGASLGTSGYYCNRVQYDYSTNAASYGNASNAAVWNIPAIAAGSATLAASCVLDIMSPQSSAYATTFSGTGSDPRTTGGGALTASGVYSPTTSVDGFVISSGGTSYTNATVRVYGYRQA